MPRKKRKRSVAARTIRDVAEVLRSEIAALRGKEVVVLRTEVTMMSAQNCLCMTEQYQADVHVATAEGPVIVAKLADASPAALATQLRKLIRDRRRSHRAHSALSGQRELPLPPPP